MASCLICKKKVSALSVLNVCKCENTYCNTHMNNHNCTYDYKNKHKEQIKNTLILVSFDKIQKL